MPAMLLGIPLHLSPSRRGDNTYSDLAEANRAFWRQTILPLTARSARALTGWLAPAYGSDLRLVPDTDEIPALASERDDLWARLQATTFLTDDEKRAAIGYGPKGAVGAADGEGREADEAGIEQRFNPNHDALGRFDFGQGGVVRVAGGRGRGGGRGNIAEAPPGQQMRLAIAQRWAEETAKRVQELDPTWKPAPSMWGTIQGEIAANEAAAQEAEARLAELQSTKSRPDYAATPGGRPFTSHARDQATDLGFTDQQIDTIIDNNVRSRAGVVDYSGRKTWEYRDARGNTVITNEQGGIVTVFSPADGGYYIEKP